MFRRVKTASGMLPVEPAGQSPDGAKPSCGGVSCSVALLVCYAHLCLFFGIGISTSLTVFLDDIVHEFDSTITTLGIFFSVRALTFGLTSPLASFLAKRYGSRVVIMAGGFLTAAGVMMTGWANSVAMVGVGVVLLTGIGSALVYIATLIFIRHNFPDSRHYALANGITVSGSSLAVSVFAPITRVLSDTYNWRGALLISSAIILHTMVFGALLRDRKVIPKGHRERLNDSASAIALIDNHANSSTVTLNGGSSPVKESISNGHGSGHHVENGNGQYAERTLMTSFDGSEAHEMTESFEHHEHHEHMEPEVVQRTKEPILADKRSTLLHGLLLFSIFLSTSSYSAVFVYLAAAGTERGLSPIESAGLLSATGISQAIVRFGHGFLVTVGCIKPLPLYIIVQFIMTIGILVLGVFQRYSVGCFAAILFGIGTGSVRSLNVVVQREVDKRAGSNALGIIGLVSEVAAAVGGLFAGLLRDRSGEYLASFMVACGMTFASTLLSVIIMLLKRFIPCQPKNHVLT